jgi:hypothetical protein
MEEKFQSITGRFNFEEAVKCVEDGGAAARVGWNGKGMFIFMRPGMEMDENQIDNLSSVSSLVKRMLLGALTNYLQPKLDRSKIEFKSYFCLFNSKADVINGWLPSIEDIKATDWVLLFNKD